PPGWSPARFWLPTGIAIVAAVVALVVLQMPRDGGADVLTVAEIRERDPRFYAWYISQPVVDLNLDAKDIAPPDQITLVEFSDFECPACARAFTDLGGLLASGDVPVRL